MENKFSTEQEKENSISVASTNNFVNPVTSKRDMRFYTIAHNELHNLTALSALANLFIGLGTTCFGIALGIYTSYSFADPKTMSGAAICLHEAGEKASFWLGIIFSVAAVVTFLYTAGTMQIIKRESQGLSPQPSSFERLATYFRR